MYTKIKKLQDLLSFLRYLKNKFGQGFTILAKLNTQGKTSIESMDIMESFKKHIMTKFDGCVVKDEHKDYVHFHITNPGNCTIFVTQGTVR